MNLSGKFGKCSLSLNTNLSLETLYQIKPLLSALNQIRVDLKGNHRLSLTFWTQVNFNPTCTRKAGVSVERSGQVHCVGEVVKSSVLVHSFSSGKEELLHVF